MPIPESFATTQQSPFLISNARISKAPIDGLGATITLTADQAGSLVIMDRAAGTIITLPPPVKGMVFEVQVLVSVTSNNHKIITDAGTTLLLGQVISNDTDTGGAAVFFAANGSTHIAITMNGTTTGGLIGTILRFTGLSTTRWNVEGIVNGSGTVATPFATS